MDVFVPMGYGRTPKVHSFFLTCAHHTGVTGKQYVEYFKTLLKDLPEDEVQPSYVEWGKNEWSGFAEYCTKQIKAAEPKNDSEEEGDKEEEEKGEAVEEKKGEAVETVKGKKTRSSPQKVPGDRIKDDDLPADLTKLPKSNLRKKGGGKPR